MPADIVGDAAHGVPCAPANIKHGIALVGRADGFLRPSGWLEGLNPAKGIECQSRGI
ncbi:hypothetical protein [Chromobacterium violaceum]|uniref:hypothetical protein n=1 Tax=Chromobacterium violaceum TaxID=536 RepID=UPI001C8CA697|nr:hypothetical protein [Chromobacterium violaceum]MBX9266056.1 hypothetical protein [Chromobacterium violaceum]MCD0492917.1 hypothetical protein [Chromobacterium violaceum]